MNNRPENVTEEDVKRWNESMENDPELPPVLFNNETIRELCYAGLWLCEQLEALGCPSEYIVRIQYTAGQASFGREPWEVHQDILESYKLNDLVFESDPDEINLN